MLIFEILFGFILLLVLPILIALFVNKKRDGEILYIKQDKTRDQRYFGKSFASLMRESNIDIETKKVKLSREENINVLSYNGFQQNDYEEILYSINMLTLVPSGICFRKEIYTKGDSFISGDTIMRAIYSEKNMIIGNNSYIARWADAEGTVAVYDNCHLGISTTSASALIIGNNCSFHRLYAPVMILGAYPQDEFPGKDNIDETILSLKPVRDSMRNIKYITDDMVNDEGILPFTVITRKNLVVTENLVVQGDIRSEEGVNVGDGAVVCGNIFAEASVYLGKNSRVLGCIFTQGDVITESGAIVGREKKNTSIVARERIRVNGPLMVYGYVSCEMGGYITEEYQGMNRVEVTYSPEEFRFFYHPLGKTPKADVSFSNKRLGHVDEVELSRYGKNQVNRAEFEKSITQGEKDSSKPIKGIKYFGALVGVCLVCIASIFLHNVIQTSNDEGPIISEMDLYRNQGLTAEMVLETEPIKIDRDFVVLKDRVLTRFTKSASDIILSADAVNNLFNIIPDKVNKYVLYVPLRIEYEGKLAKYSGNIDKGIRVFKNNISPDINYIDTRNALEAHKQAYIFFRGEPYWTALGAYYGVNEFFRSRGSKLKSLNEYEEHLYNDYKGNLFHEKLDDIDDEYKDKIYLYLEKDFDNYEKIYTRNEDGTYSRSIQPIISRTRNGLSTFVGGNTFSHAIIEGEGNNGKTVMIIGDTSAKIAASFFASSYENVYVINQTWFNQDKSSFSKVFNDYNVTDVLLINSIEKLGDDDAVSRINSIVKENW